MPKASTYPASTDTANGHVIGLDGAETIKRFPVSALATGKANADFSNVDPEVGRAALGISSRIISTSAPSGIPLDGQEWIVVDA